MGKKELKEKIAFEKAVGIRGGFKSGLIATFKFTIALILLPLLIGLSKALYQQLLRQNTLVHDNFFLGMIAYLIIHLFIHEPNKLNEAGQMLVGRLFSFFVPLRTILYSCLPVYATVFFALYFVFKWHFGHTAVIGRFIFLISFAVTMHLVVSAAQLRKESTNVLKGDYFFSLSIVYLFEVVLLAGFFYFMLSNFSFIAFVKDGLNFFMAIVAEVWRQLFVVR